MYRYIVKRSAPAPSPQSPAPTLPACVSAFSAAASIRCTTATWRWPGVPAAGRAGRSLVHADGHPAAQAQRPACHRRPARRNAATGDRATSATLARLHAGNRPRRPELHRRHVAATSRRAAGGRVVLPDGRRRRSRRAALEGAGRNISAGHAAGRPPGRASRNPTWRHCAN